MARQPFVPTPFARALTAHMCAWRRGYDGSTHPMLSHWASGIHPGFRDAAVTAIAEDEVKLHDFAAALTSSQMFAVNLFIPWRSGARAGLDGLVGRALGERVTIDRVAFEWVPPGALLGEIDGDRPREDEPATGIDVVLWGLDETRARIAVLVEVKLGEGGFTPCGGRESNGNHRKDVCASAETFFLDPCACYLKHPWGKARDRRYWEIFAGSHGTVRAAFPGARTAGGCPFSGQAQQPMRNLALAEALVQEGVVSRSWFGLCAHDQNPDVVVHWAAWRALLADAGNAPAMRASDVVAAGRADGHEAWADWMIERYRLPSP